MKKDTRMYQEGFLELTPEQLKKLEEEEKKRNEMLKKKLAESEQK